ncbi:hypothetical protein B0H11DRAFT_2254461 [Mycena galericulata]|nr:hypothetical protein B0H11DRAFT_2254461 [Mycena galericulata]
MVSDDAQLLARLLSPDLPRIAPYIAVPKLHLFPHYPACQCIGRNGIGLTDGEGIETRVETPRYAACREHGELAPAFDWVFQCPLHIDVHIDEDEDDEIPDLMSQDEYDSMKTNTIRGFKPRNLSKL